MKYFSDFAVLILAGGLSQRAGELKGLRKFSGKYWIDKQIEFYSTLRVGHIFVGLGYSYEDYLKAIPLLSQSLNSPVQKMNSTVQVIINPNPEMEMFSTIKNSLDKMIHFQWNNLFIIHVDMACPNPETLEKLSFFHKKKVVKPICSISGKSGHPILLSKEFCNDLIKLSMSIDNRLDLQIRNLKENEVQRVVVNDVSININMNTPIEWEAYINSFKNE